MQPTPLTIRSFFILAALAAAPAWAHPGHAGGMLYHTLPGLDALLALALAGLWLLYRRR